MPETPTAPVLTLGYGDRRLEDVLGLLSRHEITCLVDVRQEPQAGSRPEFSQEALKAALGERGLRYVFLGDSLGGSQEQESFQRGIEKLRKAAQQRMRVVLLASEVRPERCYRSQRIGAALAELGLTVQHLDEHGRLQSQQAVMARLQEPDAPELPDAPEWDPSDWDSLAPPPEEFGEALPEKAPALQPAAAPAFSEALAVLRKVFGYDAFRAVQEQAIRRVLAGEDTLAVMPTGGGKSLCYQLPALLFNGLTVVVSPLISLMKDQVDQLRAYGIAATFLNSSLSPQEYAEEARRVGEGEVRLLYVAPETLVRPETQRLLDRAGVRAFAIDEAHCISQWGHDFRPVYRNLLPIRKRYADAVCIALTATAAPRVRQDIQNILSIPEEGVLVSDFDRPNLFLEARRRSEGAEQVVEFLRAHPEQPGIVYCGTQEQTETLAADLSARGWKARPYHAGLDSATRNRHQSEFNRDEVQVIVATVAFGMGINKPNIRFVAHYSMPESLENYYQEIGRAGRDGLRADCLLLFGQADARLIRTFIDRGAEAERMGRQARLNAMMRYASSMQCRRGSLLPYFGDADVPENCGMCDNCTRGPVEDGVDITAAAQQFLACVQQTGQSFGIGYVIDLLRGSQNQRILSRGHHNLKVYGSGVQHSARQWRTWTDDFLDQGLVEQDLEYGSLKITAAGREVMRGERTVTAARAEAAPTRTGEPVDFDQALFEELRQVRKQIADGQGVPPYVIFSDRTLAEMAQAYPQSEASLLQMHGVGQQKLTSYGEPFLEAIRDYCARHGKEEQPRSAPRPQPKTGVGKRCAEVCRLFSEGHTLEELEERLGVQRRTLVQHLGDFVQSGEKLDPDQVLAACRCSEADREAALAAFTRLGLDRLRPVFEDLGERVPYDDIHLLRLYLRLSA